MATSAPIGSLRALGDEKEYDLGNPELNTRGQAIVHMTPTEVARIILRNEDRWVIRELIRIVLNDQQKLRLQTELLTLGEEVSATDLVGSQAANHNLWSILTFQSDLKDRLMTLFGHAKSGSINFNV